MIADSKDIRFECSKCGQHLVVEAAGAGLASSCPICNTSVTVPRPSVVARTDGEGPLEARGRTGLSTAAGSEPARPAFADPEPDDLREELIDASLINGKLVRDLQKAREEASRFQQQLKTLGDECERLNASATHTQAELKTFQTERQQFKAELSGLRQRAGAADEALTIRDAELSEAREKLAGSVPAAGIEVSKTKLAKASQLAADWEAKASAAQRSRDDAVRTGAEWKTKAETEQTEKTKVAALRESEAKAAEAAIREAQQLAADFEAKAVALDRTLAEERTQREKVTGELEDQRRALGEAHTRSKLLDVDLHATRGRLGELEAALTAAQETHSRLAAERGEVEQQFNDAKTVLAEVGELKALLARSGSELDAQGEKLRLAEETNQALTARCEQLRKESDSLRRDVTESHSGRELIETRERLEETTAERDRIAARLSAVEADLRAFTASEIAIQSELTHARSERDDALERVESLRETRAAKDNHVLRGIIARLNSDLAQRVAEVVRLKRARHGLKIAYVLFALGALAVVAFAIAVLPHALRQ